MVRFKVPQYIYIYSIYDSLVRNNSYFEPPRGRNNMLDEYIDLTKVIPRNDTQRKRSFNITRNERFAIDSLAKDTLIVIKEADKGGGIVIMNKEFYKTKLLEMLEDKSFYKLIENQTTKETMKKLKKVVSLLKEITRNERNYLLDFECKSSMFYGLPKIHKSKLINKECTQIDGEYLELLDPEDLTFRPIVAGPACETHRLGNLIDILLKVSNGAKIRNRYNQVPHPTQDTNGKVTNSQKTPQTRAKRSALSQQVTTKHI